MRLRKSITSLSDTEKSNFVKALLELKRSGKYDQYVHWHHHVMIPTVHPNEPVDPEYRNGAHRGPAFLPWHRAFLMAVEDDLQKIDKSITIPYWNWVEDAKLSDPKSAAIWKDDFMGGDGNASNQDIVETGSFAYSTGNWELVQDHTNPQSRKELQRTLGRFKAGNITIDSLPNEFDLALALSERYYDTPLWNSSPFTIGFRNRIEGWITKRGDHRVQTEGSQLHNRVHLWVGGSMTPMTSPNDPVFFLHHCFIDKIWADWQAKWKNVVKQPHYVPISGGPEGHNLNDVMHPFMKPIFDMMDIIKLGYQYEQPVTPGIPVNMKPTVLKSSFVADMDVNSISPFWAD